MEQKLVRITKLPPPPWWAAIAPLLMAAGLIFPPIALWLSYRNDAVECQLKRLTAENTSLQSRLQSNEGLSSVPMQLPTWPELVERDRSSACHACAIPRAFDRRLDGMTFLTPAGSTIYWNSWTAADWNALRPFANF